MEAITLTCACGTPILNVEPYLRDACKWACRECVDKVRRRDAYKQIKCIRCGATKALQYFPVGPYGSRDDTCMSCRSASIKKNHAKNQGKGKSQTDSKRTMNKTINQSVKVAFAKKGVA